MKTKDRKRCVGLGHEYNGIVAMLEIIAWLYIHPAILNNSKDRLESFPMLTCIFNSLNECDDMIMLLSGSMV